MDDKAFYLKALGLIVIGSVVKAAVRQLSNAIGAPSTVVNNTYVQPVVVPDDEVETSPAITDQTDNG